MIFSTTELFGWQAPTVIVAVGVYSLWVVVAFILKRALFALLQRVASKTHNEIDDLIIHSVNFPLNLMLFVWGATFTLRFITAHPRPEWIGHVAVVSTVVTVIAGILFVDLLLNDVIKLYAKRIDVLRQSQSFLSAVVRVVVWSLGALIALDSIGVSITPIVASLGIGSLAVALALQPTFENIFSGFQIFLDKPVLPGHFVRLETGEEGFIERIGWRTSWLRQGTNNTVILPNKQLVNGRILNYNYPDRALAVPVEVGVHYSSDLEHVEKVAIEVGQDVMRKTGGGVVDWMPVVRFHTFAESSINCTVVLRAAAFNMVGDVRHAFIKALTKRFAAEKIVIPYPVRALNTSQEQGAVKTL